MDKWSKPGWAMVRSAALGVMLALALAFGGAQPVLAATTAEASLELLATLPTYSGSAYTTLNGNVPEFTSSEICTSSYESYSELDDLGRAGVAMACIGEDLMPTEEREDISSVYPSGWVQASYSSVDGGYLYNRCHLIGYQLTAENDNELNLITGTRYLNVEGMLPFENLVADYIEETGNHVMYRVTPYFEGDNLVASGVQIEAYSVEDEGEGVCFNVYCFNVQPGISIDYATGASCEVEEEYAIFNGTVTLSTTSYTYNGKARKPGVTVVSAGGTTLKKGTDYTVTYASGRTDVGTYKVTVTGIGDYAGTVTTTFKIKAKSISSGTAKLSTTTYTYNGKARKPSVTLKVSVGGSTVKLTKNTDYTVTYASGRKKCGRYKVTIKGTGNYKGTITKYFKIKPAKAATPKLSSSTAGQLKVSWSKSGGSVTGYQIYYRVKGTSTWKSATTTSTSKTLKSLKKGKTYQVKVRAYKTINGSKVYGAWSTVKTKTVASSSSTSSTTVYVTETGTKYHKSGCKYLKKSKIKTTLSQALKDGYTACSVCNP